MLLVDPRRLTGPNLLARSPLVVVELALDVADVLEHARDVYLAELGRMRVALGMPADVTPLVRAHRGGAVIAYAEPIDVMLPCTEMSEWAALSACEILGARAPLPLEPKRAEIEAMIARDKSPNMLALEAEARRRSLPFFWDDDAVSVGAGARAAVWPRHQLPDVSAVAWGDLGSIPIALVTGTNGKTTSTRLLARVVREAGIKVGWSSSDGIVIGDRQIEEGDWTGPVAARTVLRNKDVELAVLETARGGILRRGLAMEWCDAALVTNVTEDHGGGYGIDDLAAMTRVKAVPALAVRKSGRVVLNANDPRLVALAKTLDPEVVFFADLDHEASARPVIDAHRAAGGRVVTAEGGVIQSAHASASTAVMGVDEIPISYGGAAEHNVENALGAVAMAGALGLPNDAVTRGLRNFQQADNPRRGDILEHGGIRVMLDFGHNPEGIRKVMRLVASLQAAGSGRLFVSASSAGDRSDHEIGEMARRLVEAKPYKITVRELGGYLRGRLPGAVPRLFRRSLIAHGFDPNAIAIVDSEVASLEKALAEAQPGDFIVVLIHLERDEVAPFLAAAGFR